MLPNTAKHFLPSSSVCSYEKKDPRTHPLLYFYLDLFNWRQHFYVQTYPETVRKKRNMHLNEGSQSKEETLMGGKNQLSRGKAMLTLSPSSELRGRYNALMDYQIKFLNPWASLIPIKFQNDARCDDWLYNLIYLGGRDRRIMVQGQPGQK
jgi:hypothetical protein